MKKQRPNQTFHALLRRKKIISLCVLVALLCAGCVSPLAVSNTDNESSKSPEAALTYTPNVTAVFTAAPTETASPAPTQIVLNNCVPENPVIEVAAVVEIIDGDTIHVEIDGAIMPVRYIGIDTAERGEQFYQEASNRNRELVLGKEVILVKDVSETDPYDRLLRYVFVDGVFVNETLVREGYAQAKEYPPDTACSRVMAEAQTEASGRSTGIWLEPATEVVIATPTQAASTTGCPNGCLQEMPGCSIKGNINSEGVKIYHVPGGEFYSRTQINPSYGERWFCTTEEAVANGWRAPRN